eukprot:scaffold3835_cov295-Chaetoceros_neogracile.AAC.11
MMRQANQMMKDPAFLEKMKKVGETEQYQQSITRTKEVMSDPEKMEDMQKKMKLKLKEGEEQLEKLEQEKKLNNAIPQIEGKPMSLEELQAEIHNPDLSVEERKKLKNKLKKRRQRQKPKLKLEKTV